MNTKKCVPRLFGGTFDPRTTFNIKEILLMAAVLGIKLFIVIKIIRMNFSNDLFLYIILIKVP